MLGPIEYHVWYDHTQGTWVIRTCHAWCACYPWRPPIYRYRTAREATAARWTLAAVSHAPDA